MDIAELKIFIDVYNRGSFAVVARERRLNPSSVSRAIASLEAELGFSLFDRTTRRLAPTEAGELYYSRVETLIGDLSQAAELARGMTLRPSGTLRILAPVSFSQLNLLPILPEFMKSYPNIKLDLVLTDALLDLVENRIDVAIRLGPLADSSYLAQRLAVMHSRICASPGYLRQFGRPRSPRDLARCDCLLLHMPGFGNRWSFRDRRGEVSHVDVGGRLKTSNAIALKEFALAGTGIILQGEWIVGRELEQGDLIDLFPEHEVTASHFDNAAWTLRPARLNEAAKVLVFLEFLRDQFASGPPWARQV